jgi:hypothetical protein
MAASRAPGGGIQKQAQHQAIILAEIGETQFATPAGKVVVMKQK